MFCSICYYAINFDDKSFKCMNNENTCNSVMCVDCLECYINHLHSENSNIVKCPDRLCEFEFSHSTIQKSDNKQIIKKYEYICYSRIEKEYKNEAILDINKKKLIEKIRDERHEFMKKSFPKSILYVVENSLSSKLKKIRKDNLKHIEELKTKKNVNCPNVYCLNGILDNDNCCVVCFDTFCNKCDKKLKENHVCDENELKSKEIMKEIIKCPKCATSIIRSEGCNHMTCAVCKTMFYYSSGEQGGSGSHNKDVVVREYRKQSVEFEKDNMYDKETVDILREIENKAPESSTGRSVLLNLMKLYITETEGKNEYELSKLKEKFYNKMASKYEIYLNKKYTKRKYYKLLSEIQKLHNNKELNKTILSQINLYM
jgi:hypothetical protein